MEPSKRRLIVVHIFCLFQACVSLPSLIGKPRIIGGPYAEQAKFSYQVSFRLLDNRTHYCSGAILNNWWIITANRCVNIYSIDELEVVYGSLRLDDDGVTNEITRYVSHPDYKPEFIENNIALVMTKREIEFIPGIVGSIRLKYRPWQADESVVISGWGVDKKENECTALYSNVLRYQTAKIISTDKCKALTGPISDTIQYGTMICTINPVGRGICRGDLGGPLIGNGDELMGIASWHLECADGKPDVYTAISPFIDWITDTIEEASC